MLLGTDWGMQVFSGECEGERLTTRIGRGSWDHGGPCGHLQGGLAPPRFSNPAVACTDA